jgi:hypothetical protein
VITADDIVELFGGGYRLASIAVDIEVDDLGRRIRRVRTIAFAATLVAPSYPRHTQRTGHSGVRRVAFAVRYSFASYRLLARPPRANLKANRPTTMTGDLMLPALEILIMLRPSNREVKLRFLLVVALQ